MSFTNRGTQPAHPPSVVTWEERAYRLACFIHNYLDDDERDKIGAEIATEAMRKLPVIAEEQRKRSFYRLKGQIHRTPDRATIRDSLTDKIKGKARSKINHKVIHLLQCQVFMESERVERNQEGMSSGLQLNQEDMLVRYLAYLIRITMEYSSFYVNLGLCRFVYDYNAKETEELYRFVIQGSPNREKAEGYFRRRKATIKQNLQERFGIYLRLVSDQGKEFFQRVEMPEQFLELLNCCFMEFQPWEVECCLTEPFNEYDRLPVLYFDGKKDDDSDIELKRIHSLLHPDCFAKLVKAKKYEKPENRLGLPLFLLNGNRTSG